MLDDTTSSLETIRRRSRTSLARRLADFEAEDQLAANEKSLDFFNNLRCFIPINSDRKRSRDDCAALARPKILCEISPTRFGYVAVSYPWNPSQGEESSTGGYSLKSSGQPVTVRDIVLDRTIAFIKYKQRQERRTDHYAPEMRPLWIDQLSIDQECSTEKKIAVQSMDLVYMNCTYAVGYLWVEIQTQSQLDLLAALLRGHIVDDRDHQRRPALVKGIDAETAVLVLELLLSITDDQWWRRAWIFQEDYLAGMDMWLLIRHGRGLKKAHLRDALGDLAGEVVVNSAELKKCASLFCLAYCRRMKRDDNIRRACEEILWKAGKYNVLHKYGRGGMEGKIQKTMTVSILKDLNSRQITDRSDLPTITANACSYDIRIGAESDEASDRSLSLSILALHVRNGEIIRNNRESPGEISKNVFKFLEDQSMVIDAPLDDGALTFMKHCRLSVIKLSRTGIHL